MSYLDRTDTFISSIITAAARDYPRASAYRVGGSVRDELLGRKVKDADYMIAGIPLDALGDYLTGAGLARGKTSVSKLKLRDGRQAGWRVASPGLGAIEIVLPRTERPRPPKPGENVHRAFDIVVDPALSIEDDAKRRDFTFNALYKRIPRDQLMADLGIAGPEVLDPTGRGLYDLQHRLITTTHEDSFRDDPLRTLRALRFVSVLDYDLSSLAYDQMQRYAVDVTGLSAKGYASGTVLDELGRLLMGSNPAKALRIARDTGVLASLLPELAPMLGFDQGSRYHDMTTDEHTFVAIETAAHVDAPLRVRMALLFHDSGKPESAWIGKDGRKHYYGHQELVRDEDGEYVETTEDHEVVGGRIWDEASSRLNATRTMRNEVRTLILNHMVPCAKIDPVRVRRERVRLGDEMLRDLYLMRLCDLSGKGQKNAKFIANIAEMEIDRARAEAHGVAKSAKDLRVNGHDLIELGVSGEAIGSTLATVLDEVVCQPDATRNDREWQLRRAGRIAGIK